MKKQLEQALEALKKQRTETNRFIDLINAEMEKAKKIGFTDRHATLTELSETENNYLGIINLKIQKVSNQLKKFN